jgi:mannosyltransferase
VHDLGLRSRTEDEEPEADGRAGRTCLDLLAPAAAAMVMVALALPRLGRRPLWLDEALTVGATQELVTTWRGTGGTMGLYYLLMWPVAHVSTDRAWLRAPSLLFAVATLMVVHEIGRRLGGRLTAACAAGAFALMWAPGRHAVEARSYTMAMFLVALAWLGLVGAVQAGRPTGEGRRWWRLFTVAMLLAPLAHGLSAVHFVTHVALLGVLSDRRRWWRACTPIAVGLAVEGAVLFGLGAGEVASWVPPLGGRQVVSILRLLVGRDPLLYVVGAFAVVTGVVLVREARDHLREGRAAEAWQALVPVVWTLGAPLIIVAVSVARPYAEPRYAIGALPGVALLLASGLSRLRLHTRGPVVVSVAAAALGVLFLTDQPRIASHEPEDWPSLVARITAGGHDGDLLLTPMLVRPPFDYAWSEPPTRGRDRPELVPLSPTDPVGEVRRFYDLAASRQSDALLAAEPGTTVWVVDRDIRRLDNLDRLVTSSVVAERYRIGDRWTFAGELYLVRLDPVS